MMKREKSYWERMRGKLWKGNRRRKERGGRALKGRGGCLIWRPEARFLDHNPSVPRSALNLVACGLLDWDFIRHQGEIKTGHRWALKVRPSLQLQQVSNVCIDNDSLEMKVTRPRCFSAAVRQVATVNRTITILISGPHSRSCLQCFPGQNFR